MSPTAPWPSLPVGIVAILRGIKPPEALSVGEALVEAGISAIEVPLNSPEPFKSIEMLAKHLSENCLIGAGTVLTAADVDRLCDAGGKLLVSPNIDIDVMRRAADRRLVTMPGVFTPSEALSALRLGATALKFFPASVMQPAGIKAIRAVLPAAALVGAVGGISERDFEAYRSAGVSVFGLGTSLYQPGFDAVEVGRRARNAVSAWQSLSA